jgi:anti-sigma factor RsiW
MQGDESDRPAPSDLSDAALWRRSSETDVVPDEAARFLDLAGFVDGQLDVEDHERVAALLAVDSLAADDVAAASMLARMALHEKPLPANGLSAQMLARASALSGAEARTRNVVAFPTRPHERQILQGMARWGSLAAAMAVVGWLGFTLGMDTSLSLSHGGQATEDGFLREMMDPATGFLRDLIGDTQT